MAEGDFFSLVEEEQSLVSWKIYLSTDLWDWVRSSTDLPCAFSATNGFIVTCKEDLKPGFGNGNPKTLFLNERFKGSIGIIGPKTDQDHIGDHVEQIKILFTELVAEAYASDKGFSKPFCFPADGHPQKLNHTYFAAFEPDNEQIKKRWMLKMEVPFYNWAVKKKFTAQNGIKFLFDISGQRTQGKTAYNTQKKILLLDKGCKDKQHKLPKSCYQDIQDILAAFEELSEIYETIVFEKREEDPGLMAIYQVFDDTD